MVVAFGPFIEIRDSRSKMRYERSGDGIDRSSFSVTRNFSQRRIENEKFRTVTSRERS
jgi:hypothetical protein